jgi:hypothetical protein
MMEPLTSKHASTAADRVDRMELALVLFEYGCRLSNVERVTQLSGLRQLRVDHGLKRPSGRVPESEGTVLRRCIGWGLAASFAVSTFERYWQVGGVKPRWALVYAYREYLTRFREWDVVGEGAGRRPAQISMNIDHLLLLVGRTFQLWRHPLTLRLYDCPHCKSRFLSDYLPPSSDAPIADECYFCQMAGRYRCDQRVSAPLDRISKPAMPPEHVTELLDALDVVHATPVEGRRAGRSVRPTLSFQA